ncbi:vitamin K epoxide reductase family protein [uncultured Dokdonia sp.]|uniref:vitamin K epoxide reductase family protein n=1 Tax=uncultured Dokdonia sp. TaxID=575653 RepID=UPI00263346A1|nr:vitamin K epoxide reductase family protein [uncultured Dokdonia sp.]
MDELIFRFLLGSHITAFSKEDIHLQLLSHADYPSVKAITDTLDYFGIDNIAANVPIDALSQLPNLFLALIEEEGDTTLALVQQQKNGVQIRTIQDKKEKRSIQEFTSQWTGTIVAIEENKKRAPLVTSFNTRMIALLVALLFAVVTTLIFTPSIPHAIYILLTVFGCFVSYLISKESIGVKDRMTSKVCNALSSTLNSCATVITSKEGRINKAFGLGDASLVYFTSLFFAITFLGIHPSILLAVAIGSVFVLGYSIYLQAIQIKQWCGLCLLVSVVLISQFVTVFLLFSGWDFSFQYLSKALVITMGITLLWGYVKPLLLRSQELRTTKKEYFSFKRNKLFFTTALQQETLENIQILPQEAQLYFGNREAPIQLTAYSNPLCGYCVAAFELYDRLLTQFPTDVGIQFVFNTPKDLENPATQIAKRTLEVYRKSKTDAFNALKDWFGDRDVDCWMEKHGTPNTMLLMDDRTLEMHREVAQQNNINYTPETLIGNQKFPKKYYEYEDLLLFVEILKERANEVTNYSLETV